MKKAFTVVLFFCSLVCKAQTFSWSGHSLVEYNVNDTVVIQVSGLPDSITPNFGISGVCFDIYHQSKTSLLILLVAPDGHSVLLMEGHGVVGENFINTCLGMDGVPFELGTAPFTGNYLPSGDLSTLNNHQNPNGNWLLIINNHHNNDTGSVHRASITFTNNPPQGNGLGGSNVGPSGPFVWPGLVCPGGASSCDLLPDMTASAQHILNGYIEYSGRIEVSNSTPNIGYGPMEIYGLDSCFCNGVPSPCNVACPAGTELQHTLRQRIYRKRPGVDTLEFYDRNAGLMTFHPTHGHLHVDNWGSFTLRTATSDPDPRNWPIIGTSVKQSYCLTNLGTCAGSPGECVDGNGNVVLRTPNNGFGFQTGCDLTQGIFSGYLDVYSQSLNEPILLDNICNGTYYLVSITDPENKFLESDETNNVAAVQITLTKQTPPPNIISNSIYLCSSTDSIILTATNAQQRVWSTGDTTSAIVVKTPGTYTVASGCGISAPLTISELTPGAAPEVSIAMKGGNVPVCPGTRLTCKARPVYGGNTPRYQWKVNGVNVGTNIDSLNLYASTERQNITCELTSSINCFASTTVLSDSILIPVYPINNFEAVVTQTKGYNPFCPGDTVTFIASAVPGTNGAYQWKVDGANAGANSPEFTSSTVQQGQIISCTINAVPLCGLNTTIGTSAGYNEIQRVSPAAYPTWYGNGRQQYLILANELLAMGISAGEIKNIGFVTNGSIGNPVILKNYSIKLAKVANVSLGTQMLSANFTTVFGPEDYTPLPNDTNTHSFFAPFIWDGVSNLLIDICFSNQVVGNANYQTLLTNTPFVSSCMYEADGASGAYACNTIVGNGTAMSRPLIIFSNSTPKEVSSNPVTLERLEPIYRFTGNGNWDIPANWLNSKMPPKHVLHCAEIIIDPVADGECILNTAQVVAPGAKITVVAGKKFKVLGNVLVQE